MKRAPALVPFFVATEDDSLDDCEKTTIHAAARLLPHVSGPVGLKRQVKGQGQNVAKIRVLWAGFMPRRGLRGFSPGFNPGNPPINGSALKGRKLTWINPTHIAPQNKLRVCLVVLETHPENLFCDDGFLLLRDVRPVSGTERPIARKNRIFCQDLLTDPFGLPSQMTPGRPRQVRCAAVGQSSRRKMKLPSIRFGLLINFGSHLRDLRALCVMLFF